MKMRPLYLALLRLAGLACGSCLPTVGAASLYWDGTSTGVNADGGAGTWSTAAGTTNWDSAATGGSDVAWTNGSAAVFGGTGGLVTVSGTVSAVSLGFGAAGYSFAGGNVTLTGTPVIDTAGNDVALGSMLAGTVSLSKSGTGTLTLSGSNTFSGAFTITGGTVKAGSATALGSSVRGTTISSGASLELNGQNLANEPVTFSGTGMGGAGAVVNNNAGSTGLLGNITLTGPGSMGGSGNCEISFGGIVTMGGNTLTKVGSGEFRLGQAVASGGNIDVQQGSFWLEKSSSLAATSAKTITIRSGALFGQSSNYSPSAQLWTVAFETGTVWQIANSPSRWDGSVTLGGTTSLDVAGSAAMTHSGIISGVGSMTKNGIGVWTLGNINTYTGGTTLNAGKAILNAAANGSGTLRGAVTVNAASTLELAVGEALGVSPGARVTPLTVNGGLVDNLANGGNTIDVANLTAARLRSGGGISSPATTSYFTLPGGCVVNSLAAGTPSLISGRLDLGSGGTAIPASFNVSSGTATEDLKIDASITETTTGHGIAKAGNGLLVLNGSCLFKGGTTVQAGTLVLGAAGSLKDSALNVKSGGRFATAAAGKQLASILAEPGSALTLPATMGNATTLAGDLTLAGGTITISPVLGAGVSPGVYDLLAAGHIVGPGVPVLGLGGAFGPTRATGSLAVVGNKLQLTLSSAGADLVWNNASAAGSSAGTWDKVLSNFSNGGGNDAFQTFDSVTFDDSAAPGAAKTISLGGTLAPARVTVNNSDGGYTFTSSGGLAGAGSLVKTGSSPLVIGGSGSYAMNGDITAGGGTLDFSGKGVSIGRLTIANGGTFDSATASASSFDFRSGSATATLSGEGAWTKTTAGTVTLAANNRLSGPGTVAAGTLVAGNSAAPNASGALGGGPVTIAAGASVVFGRSDTPTIPNTFSGAGGLTLLGSNDGTSGASYFTLTADNRNFSGPLAISNAKLSVSTVREIGGGDITVAGHSCLHVVDSLVPNALHFAASGEWGYGFSLSNGNLALMNAEMAGPVFLAGSTSTKVCGIRNVSQVSSNTISGPIMETGGPASLVLSSDFSGNILTLSGNSTYTGTTLIGGQSVLNLTGSLGATAVTVTSYSTLAGAGSIGSGGSLAFNNLAILRVNMTGGPLTVNGNVDLGPKTTISVSVAQVPVPGAPIPVLDYTGTLTGTAAQLVVDFSSSYRKAEFGFTPGHITLDIGSKALIWKGASGSQWTVGGTKLWNTDGVGETESFYKGDSVRFDDTGSGFVTSGATTLAPSSVVFDNSAKDYTVTASFYGDGSLIKRGTGNVRLISSNSHTGGTWIEAGRLEAQLTSLGSGPVSVSAGATLAGELAIKGAVTVAGTLDPGLEGQSFPSVMSTGPLVLTGTYQCQLGSSNSDTLQVTGDLKIAGSALSLNRTFLSGVPTFFTLATYTRSLTGRFNTVSGMPSGWELLYDTAGKRILVVRTTFADWAAGFSGLANATPGGDPDGDGIPNLMECVLNGNPGTSDSAIRPTLGMNPANVVFRYKRSSFMKSAINQVVQWSSDFGTWTDIPVPSSSTADVTITDNGDGTEDVTVTIPRAPGDMFVRLKAVLP